MGASDIKKNEFTRLFQIYSKPLYQELMRKTGDEALSKVILKKVFQQVYASLDQNLDYTLHWLEVLADYELLKSAPPMLSEAAAKMPEQAPQAPPPQPEAKPVGQPAQQHETSREEAPVRKKRGSGFVTFLLLLGIAICLWGIAGVLMDMQIIPTFDLGYQWFNQNVFQLF